jgi:hypothetical protein
MTLSVKVDVPTGTMGTSGKYYSSVELPINGYLDKLGIMEFHPAKKIITVPLNSIK